MIDRDIYILPTREKKDLSRGSFILLCLLFASVVLACMNGITIFIHGEFVGYFPTSFVLVVADVFHFAGCVYYISKHDYAYGQIYEKYQILNSVIYGIQNYLRILLGAMVISILVVPLYIVVILAFVVAGMFRWTRRLWK